jgi:Replication protein A C terminal
MFGGGFETGGYSQENSRRLSTDSVASRKEKKSKQRIVPTTIASLKDDELYGVCESNTLVVIVGLISQLKVEGGALEGFLNDGTGSMKIKSYFHADFSDEGFVKIIGNFRSGEKPYISVMSMKKVDNANEISTHLLEIVHSMLEIFNEAGIKLSHNSGTAPVPTVHKPVTTSSPPVRNVRDDLLNYLRSDGTEFGPSRQEIVSRLKSTESEINQILQDLSDEGLIYDTSDEHHFKAI